MKKVIFLFAVSIAMFSCKNEAKDTDIKSDTEAEIKNETPEIAYATFGETITDEDVMPSERMMEQYSKMKVGDTISTKTTGKITEVCSKKGCWMKLDMGDENIVRVRFKDYGFFMPLDAKGDVIINGAAFVTETSVEDLKHYAEDAGKSADEIAAITEPEKTYGFLADGVLLKQ